MNLYQRQVEQAFFGGLWPLLEGLACLYEAQGELKGHESVHFFCARLDGQMILA